MGRTIQSLLLRFSRVLLRFADKNGCLISFPIFIRSYFTCNVYLVILKYLVREWRVFGNKSQHACIISVGISLQGIYMYMLQRTLKNNVLKVR